MEYRPNNILRPLHKQPGNSGKNACQSMIAMDWQAARVNPPGFLYIIQLLR